MPRRKRSTKSAAGRSRRRIARISLRLVVKVSKTHNAGRPRRLDGGPSKTLDCCPSRRLNASWRSRREASSVSGRTPRRAIRRLWDRDRLRPSKSQNGCPYHRRSPSPGRQSLLCRVLVSLRNTPHLGRTTTLDGAVANPSLPCHTRTLPGLPSQCDQSAHGR